VTTPRLAATLLAALVLTAATGCAGTGNAPSAPQPTSTGATSTATTVPITPTTGSAADQARMAQLAPCGLLPDNQIGLFGYTNRSDRDDGTGDIRSCTYTAATSTRQLTIAFLTLPRHELTPSGTDTVSRETIGRHQTWRLQSGGQDLCTIYIDVGGKVVMVQAGQQGSSQQSCIHAQTAAGKLEPGLP